MTKVEKKYILESDERLSRQFSVNQRWGDPQTGFFNPLIRPYRYDPLRPQHFLLRHGMTHEQVLAIYRWPAGKPKMRLRDFRRDVMDLVGPHGAHSHHLTRQAWLSGATPQQYAWRVSSEPGLVPRPHYVEYGVLASVVAQILHETDLRWEAERGHGMAPNLRVYPKWGNPKELDVRPFEATWLVPVWRVVGPTVLRWRKYRPWPERDPRFYEELARYMPVQAYRLRTTAELIGSSFRSAREFAAWCHEPRSGVFLDVRDWDPCEARSGIFLDMRDS